MLKLAICGRIPLIKVQTTDLINVDTILNSLAPEGSEFVHTDDLAPPYSILDENEYVYVVAPEEGSVEWEDLYHYIITLEEDRCVVVVNPNDSTKTFFDGGTLPLPQKVLYDFLLNYAEPKAVKPLARTLSGLTLKEVGEVCKMAMANFGSLTSKTISHVRKQIVPNLQGLEQVNTDYMHYTPDERLAEWMTNDGRLWKMNGKIPYEILPRGHLMKGPSGTGKTMAARYIAQEWGVPLYRLDVSAALNKYIGESESNIKNALDRCDELAPCVLLIDEIEKLFRGADDTGTAGRILSMLLWWMQERRSKVFVLITSNDVDHIPEELLRPGRLNEHFTLEGIKDKSKKIEFIVTELKALKAPSQCLAQVKKMTFANQSRLPQAALSELAKGLLRQWLLDQES